MTFELFIYAVCLSSDVRVIGHRSRSREEKKTTVVKNRPELETINEEQPAENAQLV